MAKTTHDYKEWLSAHNLTEDNDLFKLYATIHSLQNYPGFEITKATAKATGEDNGWILKSTVEPSLNLHIASEKARQTLLSILNSSNYTPEGMGVELFEDWQRLINKDD